MSFLENERDFFSPHFEDVAENVRDSHCALFNVGLEFFVYLIDDTSLPFLSYFLLEDLLEYSQIDFELLLFILGYLHVLAVGKSSCSLSYFPHELLELRQHFLGFNVYQIDLIQQTTVVLEVVILKEQIQGWLGLGLFLVIVLHVYFLGRQVANLLLVLLGFLFGQLADK